VKDATLATRTERAVAHLDALLVRAESLVGRLEYLLGASHAVPAPHVGEATPPFNLPHEHDFSEIDGGPDTRRFRCSCGARIHINGQRAIISSGGDIRTQERIENGEQSESLTAD
jgi:hypothetical protein